jgi:hypothetical protein
MKSNRRLNPEIIPPLVLMATTLIFTFGGILIKGVGGGVVGFLLGLFVIGPVIGICLVHNKENKLRK